MPLQSVSDAEEGHVEYASGIPRPRDATTVSSNNDRYNQHPLHQTAIPIFHETDEQPLTGNEYFPATFESAEQHHDHSHVYRLVGSQLHQDGPLPYGSFEQPSPAMPFHHGGVVHGALPIRVNTDAAGTPPPHAFGDQDIVDANVENLLVDADMSAPPQYRQYSPFSGPSNQVEQHVYTTDVVHQDVFQGPPAPMQGIPPNPTDGYGSNGHFAFANTANSYADPNILYSHPSEMELPFDHATQSDAEEFSMAARSDNYHVYSRPLIIGQHALPPPPSPGFIPSHFNNANDYRITGSLEPLSGENAHKGHEQQLSTTKSDIIAVSGNLYQVAKKTAKKTAKKAATRTAKKVKDFPCDTCRREYTTPAGLRFVRNEESDVPATQLTTNRKHKADEECSKYRCEQCGKVFAEVKDLTRHELGVHGDPTDVFTHYCQTCGYGSSRRDLFERHEKSRRYHAMVPANAFFQDDAASIPYEDALAEQDGYAVSGRLEGQDELSADNQASIQKVIDADAMDLDKRPVTYSPARDLQPQVFRGPSGSSGHGVLLDIQENDLGYGPSLERPQLRRFNHAPLIGDAGPSTCLPSQSSVPTESFTRLSLASSGLSSDQWVGIDDEPYEQQTGSIFNDMPENEATEDMRHANEDDVNETCDANVDETMFDDSSR